MLFAKETITQQVESFKLLGFETAMKTLGEYAVTMRYNDRIYKFSDPDPDVVIAQLAHLYKNFRPRNYSTYVSQYSIKRYY